MNRKNIFDDEIVNRKTACAKFSIEELVENTDTADIKFFLIELLKDNPMLLQ